MSLSKERQGELALEFLRLTYLDDLTEGGPMTDADATILMEELVSVCCRAKLDPDAGYLEWFEFIRVILPEECRPVFDLSVSLFGIPRDLPEA